MRRTTILGALTGKDIYLPIRVRRDGGPRCRMTSRSRSPRIRPTGRPMRRPRAHGFRDRDLQRDGDRQRGRPASSSSRTEPSLPDAIAPCSVAWDATARWRPHARPWRGMRRISPRARTVWFQRNRQVTLESDGDIVG